MIKLLDRQQAVFSFPLHYIKATEAFNKSAKTVDDVVTLQTRLAKIEGLSTKVQANIVQQAELSVRHTIDIIVSKD